MVEQPAVNRRVAGSSPASGANLSNLFGPMYWVYILQNSSGKFYIGHTDDLTCRLHSHNRTDKVAGKFTRKNGPWELIWSEQHNSRAAASARERQIKAMKSARWIRETLLLNGRVPTSRD